MQKKIFKKLKKILIWFCVWSLSVTALLGVNLSHAKADTLPTVEFQMPINGSGLESVAIFQIPIVLFGEAASSDITVNIAIDNINTTANLSDYNLPSEVTINAGDTTGYLPLQIIDNNLVNGPKTVALQLTGISANAQLAASNTEFTYTILDDDLLTTLTTTPVLPNGQNDWFVENTPQITLSVNDLNATTFYQWSTNNHATDNWLTYNQPILGQEGDNWLCYRSEDVSVSEIENAKCQEIKVDTVIPVIGEVAAILTSDNQVQLSWDTVTDADHYEVYRGGTLIATVSNPGYLDNTVATGQNYAYQIVAVDAAGNQSQPETANIFVPQSIIVTPPVVVTELEPSAPPVIQPAISSGVSTYKPSVVTPEVKAAETPEVTPVNNGEETSESSNWNKLLLAISILIIAAGAAVGGYYGYQWWMMQRDNDDKPKEDKNNSKSRW